jgi:hypothetical protein
MFLLQPAQMAMLNQQSLLLHWQLGYDLFVSPEDIDVSLILQGKAGHGTDDAGLANYIIDNICEVRKDCIVFVSPSYADVVSNPNGEVDAMIAYRNALSNSSYAFIDSGYKYRYDKYNDLYRYTPLNGDIAGLAVRTDNNRDPWFSPAGYNRGLIKNVVKLAFNPNKAQRDILYPKDINPVITQPGQGTLLFGDKTALGLQVHLIVSTFVVCLSFLKKQSLVLLRLHSLSSTTSSQERSSKILLSHSCVMFKAAVVSTTSV